MKKGLLIGFILLSVFGCEVQQKKGEPIDIKKEEPEIIEIEEKEEYVDDNEVKIAFYEGNGGTYKKLKTFKSKVEGFKEIGIFSMLLSEEDEVLGSSRKGLYQELSKNYSNFSNYKIGYSVNFKLLMEKYLKIF